MTDERDDKPDNVLHLPGVHTAPTAFQRITRDFNIEKNREWKAVLAKAEELKELDPLLSEELALIGALFATLLSMRVRLRELEKRVDKLEGVVLVPEPSPRDEDERH